MPRVPFTTVKWEKNRIRIIDQTKLPGKLSYRFCGNINQAWRAIRNLEVRGAPALGVMAAYSLYLGVKGTKTESFKFFMRQLDKHIRYLSSSRPTAVNLGWALKRLRQAALNNKGKSVTEIKEIILSEAQAIFEEDGIMCEKIGKQGTKLLKDRKSFLTHCNAGALATAGIGTALGVLYSLKEKGVKFEVYADETRPLLQGARLSAWELKKAGIKVTLICDSMAATVMSSRRIDCVLVGADRIAANGDTANKIGTYNLAVLARFHRLPFYIAAPSSTFDLSLGSGKDIPIEQRDAEEVRKIKGKQVAPRQVAVFNPAFDVTPARLITAIITEKGVIPSPGRQNIRKIIA